MAKHRIPVLMNGSKYLLALTSSEVIQLRELILDTGTKSGGQPRPGSFLYDMFEKLIPLYQHALWRRQNQHKRQRLAKRKGDELATLEKMLGEPTDPEARS